MSLQQNVSTLLREPVGATRRYEVDADLLIDDERHRVGGSALLLRTKDGVLATARLEGCLHQPCSRCLRDTETPLRLVIEDEFFARVDPLTGAKLPPPDDPEAFLIDAQHVIDLTDAVRQYWTTALPMQPLCQPGCCGLCSVCGADLNAGACSCRPEDDSRWSALRQFAVRSEGS